MTKWWRRMRGYRWSWLGVAAWLLLGVVAGVMIEQWYQDNFGDEDDGADQEQSWVIGK